MCKKKHKKQTKKENAGIQDQHILPKSYYNIKKKEVV